MKALMLYGVLACSLSAMIPHAMAQSSYPAAPIRLVVGFPPGAAPDAVARLIAQRLSAQMNGSVIVDNRLGANGNIGAEFVAKANPDGYTLMVNTSSVVFGPALGEKLGYDVLRDLAPVALLASSPFLLIVHPSVPANNLAEFIAHVRANPDKLVYGSSGTGGVTHLGPLLLLQANGLTALHVPYKGGAPAMIDLVGGRLQFRFADLTSTLPLLKEGRIRVLANGALKRSPQLPEVPTISETMPGFELTTWQAMMAPARTPAAIIARLNGEVVKALQNPDMKSRLAQQGMEPQGSTSEEYGAYLRNDLERWTKVIKTANIKLDE